MNDLWFDARAERRTRIRRAEAVCARYLRMQAWMEASEPRDRDRLWLDLLFRHPAAHLELRRVTEADVRRRLEYARTEVQMLRAGAPLPEGPHTVARERAPRCAIVDLEWILREVRALQRLAQGERRRTHRNREPFAWDRVVQAYEAAGRPDPIRPLRPEDVERALAIPRKDRIRTFAEWAERRHGAEGWVSDLLGERTDFVEWGRLEDLPEGRPVRADIKEEPLVLVRRSDQVWAMEGVCPHRGGDLAEGRIVGDAIECPIHAWRFELQTGQESRGRCRPLKRRAVSCVDGCVRIGQA